VGPFIHEKNVFFSLFISRRCVAFDIKSRHCHTFSSERKKKKDSFFNDLNFSPSLLLMKLRGQNYVAHILKPSLLFAGDAEAYLGGVVRQLYLACQYLACHNLACCLSSAY
jgi:hypothetical protein